MSERPAGGNGAVHVRPINAVAAEIVSIWHGQRHGGHVAAVTVGYLAMATQCVWVIVGPSTAALEIAASIAFTASPAPAHKEISSLPPLPLPVSLPTPSLSVPVASPLERFHCDQCTL